MTLHPVQSDLESKPVWFPSFERELHLDSQREPQSMPRRRWKERNGGRNLRGWRRHAVFLSQCELDQFLREKRPPCTPQIANRPWLLAAKKRVQVMSGGFWQTPFSYSYTAKCSAVWFGERRCCGNRASWLRPYFWSFRGVLHLAEPVEGVI